LAYLSPREKLLKGGNMLEQELLKPLAGIYTAISKEPKIESPENTLGVTICSVDILFSEDGQDPPIAHVESILYLVLDRGKDTEQAFLSDQLRPDTLDSVRSATDILKSGGIPTKIGAVPIFEQPASKAV
jgi:hypothetical protein